MSDQVWKTAIEDFLHYISNRTSAGLAPKSVERHDTTLRQLRLWAEEQAVPLAAYNGRDWRTYASLRQKRVSPRTVYEDFQSARRFFAYCRTRGLVAEDPLRDYVGKRPPRKSPGFVPTGAILQSLLAAVYSKHDPAVNPHARFINDTLNLRFAERDRAIILSLIATGARVHEILALKYANLDRDRCQMLLVKTKGNKERIVPFTESLLEHMEPWLLFRDKLEKDAAIERKRAAEAASNPLAPAVRAVLNLLTGSDAGMTVDRIVAKLEVAGEPSGPIVVKRRLVRLADLGLATCSGRNGAEKWTACPGVHAPAEPIADTLFITRYGDPIQVEAFSKQFARYVRYAEVPKFTCHKLRHFTLSMLTHEDMPAAQHIAGHEEISTTEIYSHTYLHDMRRAMEKADPLGQIFVNRRTANTRKRRNNIF